MRTTILTLTFIFSTALLFGQSADKVEQIWKRVERIEKYNRYTINKLDNSEWMEQITDGGGELIGYFRNRRLVQIFQRVELSSCTVIYVYYFQGNALILCYGEERNSTNSFDYNKPSSGMRCWFYFDNESLIKSKVVGHTRCSAEPSDSQAPTILSDSKRYSELLKKHYHVNHDHSY